jgi:hypothetical protein
VTMIERFYASQLEGNLVINELHQRRGWESMKLTVGAQNASEQR